MCCVDTWLLYKVGRGTRVRCVPNSFYEEMSKVPLGNKFDDEGFATLTPFQFHFAQEESMNAEDVQAKLFPTSLENATETQM